VHSRQQCTFENFTGDGALLRECTLRIIIIAQLIVANFSPDIANQAHPLNHHD
jgi:hypothetical protein